MPSRSSQPFDRYTQRARQSKRRDFLPNSDSSPAAQHLHNWTRRLLYGILRIIFHNQPILNKLPQSEVKSILIIPFGDAIGDLVLATTIWRTVKSRIPSCRIGVITSPRNASLLSADSDVDATYEFTGRRDWRHLSELLRARRDRYQIVLNLHLTHLSDYGLFANILGPRAVKITANHPRRNLYEIMFNYIGLRDRHTIGISMLSLELLSEVIEFDPPLRLEESWPTLVIPRDAVERVKERLAGIHDFILIQQQAATPFREWGTTNSIELAKRYLELYPASAVFLIASPPMLPALEQITASANDPRIGTFPTETLYELAALIQLARLVVSPETSIPHFASAARTPVVILLPDRENIPMEWLPVGTPSRMLAPERRGDAVETITVDGVLEAVCDLLGADQNSSQTSLNRSLPPHPMFQRANGERLLEEFSVLNHQTEPALQ
ncbi:MAG TPA: glycosyltransferase family 9 protein [Candidatus Kapabacteria bacterium]|nr:glycosyltransferase family 9 protein [Candidatus Kapabacteria bacterium]